MQQRTIGTVNAEDLYRREVLSQWLAETDRAVSALRSWRSILEAWLSAGRPVDPHAFDLALSMLTRAGLDEWAEWCAAGGGLDGLAAALKAYQPAVANMACEDAPPDAPVIQFLLPTTT